MTGAEREALLESVIRSAIALGAMSDSIMRQCVLLKAEGEQSLEQEQESQEKAGNADASRAEGGAQGAGDDEVVFDDLNPRVFGKSGGARATIPQRPPESEE